MVANASNFVFQQQCPPTDLGFNFDANKQQRQLIAELENKNRCSLVIYWKLIRVIVLMVGSAVNEVLLVV